jgi:hypothetical protein
MTTQCPTLETRPTQVEKKSFERHDPFPDQASGPDTFNRPRGYDMQRTAPRRAAEERMLQGMPSQPYPPGPQVPATGLTGYKYPAAVPH